MNNFHGGPGGPFPGPGFGPGFGRRDSAVLIRTC